MKTKEVCQRLSVTRKMLRVYEAQGLLEASRKENNYRDYTQEEFLRIQIIILLRKLGFSLKDIKNVLNKRLSEHRYLHGLYAQLKALEIQIENLQAVQYRLTNAINRLLEVPEEELDPDKIFLSSYIECAPVKLYEELLKKWNFDEMATDYVDRYLKEDQNYLYGIQNTAKVLSERTGRFVDIGGGTCNLWENVRGQKELLVVEKSLNMILAARQKTPWARFVLGDILDTEQMCELGKFDTVVCTFTLHHIAYDKQKQALRNLMVLCKEEGSVIIADRCFLSQAHKEQTIRDLEEREETEELERIIWDFYLVLTDVEQHVAEMGGQIARLFLDGEIVGLEIRPSK